MFTGIVTDVGRVREAVDSDGGRRLTLETVFDTATIGAGASIACGGVCLTVVATGPQWFAADVSRETLSRTTIGTWQVGTRVNLERPLKAGEELGGHVVLGHVDGVGRVTNVAPDGENRRVGIEAPETLGRYLAPKGSIAVDGVSLTVNEVEGSRFGVNLIPYTWQHTTFAELARGQPVNLEVDMLARYAVRALEYGKVFGNGE
ncbi:MAG: riboflavin synthase [Alphaproteobacteria bacterium]